MAASSINRSLEVTPTWALATVCFVFIFLGICIEYLIHLAGHFLKKHKKAAMYETMEKLKSVTQRSISEICIPSKVANSMLPCQNQTGTMTTKVLEHLWVSFTHDQMSQSQFEDINVSHHGRKLAAATSNSPDHCASKGMSSLMSEQGINQLNIFIFVIAAMQIVYSVATMGLGRAKAHLSTNNSFNFRKYIQRSLEDDFKAIIGIRVMVQGLCGYITLPLYALVTQMGSEYKSAILEEHTVHAIKQWHSNVKHKRKTECEIQDDSSTVGIQSRTPSPDISSHRRSPTFSDFASRGGANHEITEDNEIVAVDDYLQEGQNRELGQNGPEYDHQRF
ncbi:hypothetical protein DH2020_028190 [Rehmannia glutinosa]|uniref:MLO-like protein n=1 Tax=Rehmannia glutinosa TaxID=99300 RepID=A0ABR0VUV1_REHGL